MDAVNLDAADSISKLPGTLHLCNRQPRRNRSYDPALTGCNFPSAQMSMRLEHLGARRTVATNVGRGHLA
jgi:hypothetical protein